MKTYVPTTSHIIKPKQENGASWFLVLTEEAFNIKAGTSWVMPLERRDGLHRVLIAPEWWVRCDRITSLSSKHWKDYEFVKLLPPISFNKIIGRIGDILGYGIPFTSPPTGADPSSR